MKGGIPSPLHNPPMRFQAWPHRFVSHRFVYSLKLRRISPKLFCVGETDCSRRADAAPVTSSIGAMTCLGRGSGDLSAPQKIVQIPEGRLLAGGVCDQGQVDLTREAGALEEGELIEQNGVLRL